AADGVAGVGQTVAEHRLRLVRAAKFFQQPLGDDDAAKRKIARGDALGEGDHVGFEAKHLAGSKDMAEAAEGSDHLVRDVEYVVFPADFADTLQIAIRRDDDPARRLDRLADKGANALRTDSLHGPPKLRHEKNGKTFPTHALGAPQRIGRGELDNKSVRAVHPVAVARAAIERGGKIG